MSRSMIKKEQSFNSNYLSLSRQPSFFEGQLSYNFALSQRFLDFKNVFR